jgi:hypothetical protein
VSAAGTATVVRPPDPDYPRLWALVNAGNHDRYMLVSCLCPGGKPALAVTSSWRRCL